MDISYNERNLEHVKRKVESGRYDTPDDVLAKALSLLDERDEALSEELADVRAKIEEASEQSKNGRYTIYTDETLHELFEDVKRRGRERRARRNAEHAD
jgi:hypothetical protein